MSKQKEALKCALSVLTELNGMDTDNVSMTIWVNDEIDLIEQALAEPEQEPVAWMWTFADDDGASFSSKEPTISIRDGVNYVPLYTAPPARKPLIDDLMEALKQIAQYPSSRFEEMSIESAREIARAAITKARGIPDV